MMPTVIEPTQYCNLATAAARAAVSTRTLRRAIAAGRLPAVRVGNNFRIAVQDLDGFMRSNPGTIYRAPTPPSAA